VEEILTVLQLGCGVQLDKRQAVRLGTLITNLQNELALAKQEADHCRACCDELRTKLDTLEADVLDREADLIHTAPDASGLAWSKSERGIFANIASMMKSRAALARAKAGK
jgi:hypothetical protein